MSETRFFASARVERLIRDSGAFRVSAGAIDALNDRITERGLEISRIAVEVVKNSGRKTVKDSDIRLANKRIN